MRLADVARLEPIAAPATQARFLALIYCVGGALAVVAAGCADVGASDSRALLIVGCVAVACSGGLALLARRTRQGVVDAGFFFGAALISVLTAASDPIGAPFAFFFVWGPLVSAMFSTAARCLALVTTAAAMPFVLFGGDRWLMSTTAAVTELAIAILVWWMRLRISRSNGQLREQARTDGLTGLLNRTAFRDALDVELERARRTGRMVGLVLCDLDHFKRLNDRLGHAAGDVTLQRVADALRRGVRSADVVGRLGGEELAVLLVDLDEVVEAAALAERLLEAIRAIDVDGHPITASAGVAVAPMHASGAAALVGAADRALYRAKSDGRDRVRVHDGSSAIGRVLPSAVASGAYLGTLLDLAESFDLRFSGHTRHSESVARYASAIAGELGWPAYDVHRIHLAGVLHDVGKVTIPRDILEKPGALDDDEWVMMRHHPELGSRMLDEAALEDIGQWVLSHHERPDGRGYPQGLTGEAIPLGGRILAVADAYEAMTNERPYRDAMPRVEAIAELRRCAGSAFDARIVDAFLEVLRREAPEPAAARA